MSEQTPEFTPPLAGAALVKSAIATHADRLIDGAVDDLATLWTPALDLLSPDVLRDVVAWRLDQPQYGGFKKPPAEPLAPVSDDPVVRQNATNSAYAAAFVAQRKAATTGELIGRTHAAPPPKAPDERNAAFAAAFRKAKVPVASARYG